MTLSTTVSTPRKLWLVRHAAPLIGRGVCYGALDVAADVPATQAAARQLAEALPQRAAVWSSTLQRCEQLTKSIQGLRPDLTLRHDARLTEMNFGRWEGQTWDAIGPTAINAWTSDFAHHAPGGAESVDGFMQRVAAAFDETRHAGPGGQDAVWITHAGVIRAATLLAAGVRSIAHAEQWPAAAPAFGEWTWLTFAD